MTAGPRIIRLVVPGEPRGKGRPRFNPGTRQVYTPGDTAREEMRILAHWRAAGQPRLEGPITAHIEAVVRRPISHRNRHGELSAEGLRTPLPVRKPDVDNVLKLVLDALQDRTESTPVGRRVVERAFHDDTQIITAVTTRRWAEITEREHTLIKLAEITPAADAGGQEAATS